MSENQQTYAMIKPHAMAKKAEIHQAIKDGGFKIVMDADITLTKEQAETFYAEHKGRPFFEDLTKMMSSGPINCLVLEKSPEAIKAWRQLIGPTNSQKARDEAPNSIRARFGVDGSQNAVHGSDRLTILNTL